MNETVWRGLLYDKKISICTQLEAKKIDFSNDKFLEIKFFDGINKEVKTIRTKRLHVAAGPISSATLLAKSRLIRWKDTNFQWHPMIRVIARTKSSDLGFNDIDPYQAWTPDRKLKFGSAVSTPPLLSIALGRAVSKEEEDSLRSYYVSYSSTGKGGIFPFLNLPWYVFSKEDRRLAKEGLELLKRIISQGGGEIVDVKNLSHRKQSTVHIFGTLPLGSRIYTANSNKLNSDPRIRVSDGSLIPDGPGVNPQGVIMTLVQLANRDLS
jgi:hypothetical protein